MAAEDLRVLLVGVPSGIGKPAVCAALGRRLGVAWLQVDDLRLALERNGVSIPDPDRDAPGSGPPGFIAVARLLLALQPS